MTRSILTALAALLFLSLSPSGSTYALDPDFDALARQKGVSALELLTKPTLYRETELNSMPTSEDDFEFLLDRPRTSVALAGAFHKSLDKYTIALTKPGIYHIDDGGRLVGDMELVLNRPGERMYYISGYWTIILGVKLRGRMALVVQEKERDSVKGKALDVKAKGYMLVDNSVAGAAFKLAAYLFPKKVDARIDRFATAVKKVVYAVHDDPDDASKRLEQARMVPPEEAREFRARFSVRNPASVAP